MNKFTKRLLSGALVLPLLFGSISAAAASPSTKSTPAKSMTTKAKAAVAGTSILGAAALTIAGVHLYVDRKLEVVVIGGEGHTQSELLRDFREGAKDGSNKLKLTELISKIVAGGKTAGPSEYTQDDIHVAPLGYKGLHRARFENWNIKHIYNGPELNNGIIQDTKEVGKSLRKADLIIVIATGKDQLQSIYELLDQYTVQYSCGCAFSCSAMIVEFVCVDGFPSIKQAITTNTTTLLGGGRINNSYIHKSANAIARTELEPTGDICFADRRSINFAKVFHIFYWDRRPDRGDRAEKYVHRHTTGNYCIDLNDFFLYW